MRSAARGGRLVATILSAALLASACSDDDSAAGSGTEPATDESPASPVATAGGTDGSVPVIGEPQQEAVSRPGFDIDAVLAADPDCVSPVSGEPLRIGYAADFSDLGGFADRPGSEAARHLARLINCSGGIDGTPVEVVVEDVQGDALQTRAGVKALLDAGVVAILGPPFADPGFRILQQTQSRVPVIFVGSTEPALGNDANLSYLAAFNDTQGATAAAQFALTKGWTKAATMSFPGPYFGYHSLVFQSVYRGGGGELTGDYAFVPGETQDFSETVSEIAANPPEVIYTTVLADQLVALRQQLEEAGLGDIELLESDAFEATGGYTLAGIDGIYHATHTFPGEDSRVNRLSESMAAANGVPPAAPSMAALAGDAICVIADTYLRVRSLDPVVLGEGISQAQQVQGVTGVLSYNGSGLPTKPIYIHHVEDGQAALAATIGG